MKIVRKKLLYVLFCLGAFIVPNYSFAENNAQSIYEDLPVLLQDWSSHLDAQDQFKFFAKLVVFLEKYSHDADAITRSKDIFENLNVLLQNFNPHLDEQDKLN